MHLSCQTFTLERFFWKSLSKVKSRDCPCVHFKRDKEKETFAKQNLYFAKVSFEIKLWYGPRAKCTHEGQSRN